MRTHVYSQEEKYPVAILIKEAAFDIPQLTHYYVEQLEMLGVPRESIMLVGLPYNDNGKANVGWIKDRVAEILPYLKSYGAEYIYCADAQFFKRFANIQNAAHQQGYTHSMENVSLDYNYNVCLGLNYQALFYNESKRDVLDLSLQGMVSAYTGGIRLFTNSTDKVEVRTPYYDTEIIAELKALLDKPMLSADIETFSLKHWLAGIGSFGLGISEAEAVAFSVDHHDDGTGATYRAVNRNRYTIIKHFLEKYQGKLIWHNSTFDLKILIYVLWMDSDPTNVAGMRKGIEVMTRLLEDTKLIVYLATNSADGNELGLKPNAHPYLGNYGEDVKDILKLSRERLLEYNGMDCAATWYVYNTYRPTMVKDKQLDVYENIFIESVPTIVEMELTGTPLCPRRLYEVENELQTIVTDALTSMGAVPGYEHNRTPSMQKFYEIHHTRLMNAANTKLKTKQHPIEHFSKHMFNPGSGTQLQLLLFDVMGLPVLDKTANGAPATKRKIIEKLLNHVEEGSADYKMLEQIIRYGQASKILSTFIPAFNAGHLRKDGYIWLHGSYNLGGTVSGRLSSSDPNMQNLPSGSEFGKLIKSIFVATETKVMTGADFNSLEDYISALTTKDPNKLKVYLEGFDGHTLRAFNYWPEKFPYDELTPELSHKAKKDQILEVIRANSKGPTFSLTYQGTYHTLMKDQGFSEADAKNVEKSFKELYAVSIQWVDNKLDQAHLDGYITAAFGLRLRTPLTKQCLRNHSSTPHSAKKEGRTAGNALGQSYGLLNCRAANAFRRRLINSPYAERIQISMQIHDAIYLISDRDPEVIKWINDNLIAEMQWQELPEIQHDTVKLGAALDIFYPSWAKATELPNFCDIESIVTLRP